MADKDVEKPKGVKIPLVQKKVGFIDNIKSAWKLPSIQFNGAGLLLMGSFEFAKSVWAEMPGEVKDLVPHATQIATVLFGLSLVARIVKTREINHADTEDK